MLPKPIQHSYTFYKAYTEELATWLLDAAYQLGYQPPSVAAAIPTTAKRIKHRRKGKASSLKETYIAPIQHRVTIKDLQTLAEVVGSSAITVPEYVLSILKQIIYLRKHVTSWFVGRGNSMSNDRHTYFITVLEKMYGELAWRTRTNQLTEPCVCAIT